MLAEKLGFRPVCGAFAPAPDPPVNDGHVLLLTAGVGFPAAALLRATSSERAATVTKAKPRG